MFISGVLSGKKFIALVLSAIVVVLLLRIVGAGLVGDGKIRSERDVVKFLVDKGWEVNEEPTEVKTVEIPKNFSDVYENYNNIQKKSGYDLSRHKARTAVRYTFEVTNFTDKTGVFANVLVVDGEVAGGDICSYAMDGFMVGLDGK
jgi:hypothetical protein